MLAALKRRLSGLVVAFPALVLALGAVTPTAAQAAAAPNETSTGSITVKKSNDVQFEVGDTIHLHMIVNTTFDGDNNTVTSDWNAQGLDTTKTLPDFKTAWEGNSHQPTSTEVNQVVAARKADATEAKSLAITADNLADVNQVATLSQFLPDDLSRFAPLCMRLPAVGKM